VIWAPAPKRRAYLALAAAGVLAAIAFRRPELAILAAPFGALAALAPSRAPHVTVGAITVAPERVLEGEHVVARLDLEVAGPVGSVEIAPSVPAAFALTGATPLALAVKPPAAVHVQLDVRAQRWGAHSPGAVAVRVRDRAGMAVAERRVEIARPVRVLPRTEALRDLIAPAGTQPAPGDWPSRLRGGGSELADIRPFVPGDPLRAINWRATARRGEPFVTERRAERTAEVVLFLDAFLDVGGTIERAVRAAVALAREHLARRDRVGVVGFGGFLWWLAPGVGRGQDVRIVDALLRSHAITSEAWRDVRQVPSRVLPPRATVIALTPLVDERAVAALADLARRRFDVVVVEVEPGAPPARNEPEAVADRLYALEREELRARGARHGVPCVRWDEERPLHVAVEEVMAWRRRPVRA
jgi:uncharacterized protein (DUF58 family)